MLGLYIKYKRMENTNGGFRLIVLDCTLHCLVAKIASCFVMKDMVDLLSPDN